MTVAGDLFSNVVASFVTDGFRRGYSEIRSAVKRRHSIDRAMSGVGLPEADARLKKALSDLQLVVGNARGELTEPVAAFIREVERSAIPESIARCVLADGDPDAIYPAFELIFRAFGDKIPTDPRKFFDAFYTAIRLRLEQHVKDPALLEFVQTQNKELSRQFAEVARALRESAQLSTPLSLDDVADARLRLARSIEAANRYLTVETLQGAKRCRIKQLVVPPRLVTAMATVARRDTRKARSQYEEASYTPYLQFKTSVSRGVVLGDPGGGKSTLTQLLCFDNANSIILESSFPGKPEIDPTELRIPLRIILRSFDKRRQASSGYNFFSYLIDEIKEVFDNDTGFCARLLRHFLTLGNALIIFDGLDEILEVERRREMVSLIEQFSNNYAACPALVTSRFVGYRDAPMADEFGIYHLAAFNDEEVSNFAYKFIKIIETLKKQDAKAKAQRFLAQTNNVAPDLRENPLMLGLMVYLFAYRGDVPSNRPEIYKECATLMFEKWDQRRDIIFKIPADFDLLDLFSYLASKIFGSAETEDGVSREWLITELRSFFENWYLDKAKALQAARSLVDFITGRAWVMYDVGPNIFKFTHRTFLEYFFARHLLSSSESINTLIRTHLLKKIKNSEWDVVAHLALQTAVFRDAGKMSQAADTIVGVLREETPARKSTVALLTFVSKTLEYLLLPEKRYCEVIELVCAIAIATGGTVDIRAITVICEIITHSKRREGIAKASIYKVMREKLRGGRSPERDFCMFTIAVASDADSRIRFHQHDPRMLWRLAQSNSNYFFF